MSTQPNSFNLPPLPKRPRPRQDVLVYEDQNDEAVNQPATFSCCPLGLQLYTRQEVEPFKKLSFKFDAPGSDGSTVHIECSGVVVHCRPDGDDLHRIWVTFTNLDPDTREKLLSMSKSAERICPYCENF